MRLLFVADGRSPTAVNWMRYFVDRGDEVFLASTFACQPDLKLSGLEIVPVAFSGLKTSSTASSSSATRGRLWGASTLRLRTRLRQWLGPLTISRSSGRLRGVCERVRPDLIHAMRIPYEGMLAADAGVLAPLLVSVWGNDFTLHAAAAPMMGYYTRWTLQVAFALHTDCQRDLRLAREWGFAAQKPSLVVPGSGGVRSQVFFPPSEPSTRPLVVNPRGFRAYVSNQAFFQAIPLVLKKRPEVRFACTAMAGEPQVLEWIDQLGISSAVELLPVYSQPQLADLFRSAQVVVSPTTHDGTPNSLLEALACGCFPVAGDLESIREWIVSGKNGLLVDANDPRALAEAILQGLNNPSLRKQAAEINSAMLAERAEYSRCMQLAADFYSRLTNNTI